MKVAVQFEHRAARIIVNLGFFEVETWDRLSGGQELHGESEAAATTRILLIQV
jgi:hypothetical protein